MKINRYYRNYEDYLTFQSEKTLNPEKRNAWLGEEWNLKVEGFKREFHKFGNFLTKDTKSLCVGARTGQEVVALKELGVEDVTGVDIVPCEPNVLKGDMHSLDFDDETFDFVYTNVINYSLDPEKMMTELERVLKIDGVLFLQCQFNMDQSKYAEMIIENPIHDILTLTNTVFCIACQPIEKNFAGTNFEYVFKKSKELTEIYKEYGAYEDVKVPEGYEILWSEINLPIQEKKLDNAGIVSLKSRSSILDNLKKRGFYLTRFADAFSCKHIAEVGTAEGWQFYNFCKYLSDLGVDDSSVSTCDPRDVRNAKYNNLYSNDKRFSYIQGTSLEMSSSLNNVDMFYIDGLHDEGSVIRDVMTLENCQTGASIPVWIFDDFDERFGCSKDIFTLCQASRCFKVYKIGDTASGYPSHQVIVLGNFKGNQE